MQTQAWHAFFYTQKDSNTDEVMAVEVTSVYDNNQLGLS